MTGGARRGIGIGVRGDGPGSARWKGRGFFSKVAGIRTSVALAGHDPQWAAAECSYAVAWPTHQGRLDEGQRCWFTGARARPG